MWWMWWAQPFVLLELFYKFAVLFMPIKSGRN